MLESGQEKNNRVSAVTLLNLSYIQVVASQAYRQPVNTVLKVFYFAGDNN